jgi:hypothetical protein
VAAPALSKTPSVADSSASEDAISPKKQLLLAQPISCHPQLLITPNSRSLLPENNPLHRPGPPNEIKRSQTETPLRGAENRLFELIEEYKRNVQMLDVSRAFLLEQQTDGSSLAKEAITPNVPPPMAPSIMSEDTIVQSPSSSTEDMRRTPTSMSEDDEDLSSKLEAQLKLAKEQIEILRRTNDRLEGDFRTAKGREDRLRGHLHRVNETKSRSEKSLIETTNQKEMLQNEVKALSTLSSRLATELHEHQLKLTAFAVERDELNTKSDSLKAERHQLNMELDGARQEMNQFHKLDSDRQSQLGQIMQQAASVESHLKAALDRIDTISREYADSKVELESVRETQGSYEKQLSVIQFRLMLATSAREEHRAQVDILNEREIKLRIEINELKEQNNLLAEEAASCRNQLEILNKSLQSMEAQLERSKNQTLSYRKLSEETLQKRLHLEDSLLLSQKENHVANKRMHLLGDKLDALSEEKAKLRAQLRQSKSALDAAYEENSRLEDVVEKQESELLSAQDFISQMDKQMASIAEDSRQSQAKQEESQKALDVVRRQSEKKAATYDNEIDRLVDANFSLQNVLNALSLGLKSSSPGCQSTETPIDMQHIPERELGALKSLLAEELSKLQDTKSMLDSIISSLLSAKAQVVETKSQASTPPTIPTGIPTTEPRVYVKADPGHVKTDSGIDIQSQASSSTSDVFRRGVISSSRSSIRDDLTATPPNQSPSTSMFRSHNTLKKPRRMSSWSSSESGFSTFRASRDASPSPISVTTTWTASISDAENVDIKPSVSVQIYAEPPLSRSSSQRLISSPSQSPAPETRKRISSQSAFETSRQRYRSSPNLRGDSVSDDSVTLNGSAPVPFPELRTDDATETESILSRRSLDSNLVRPSIDATSPVEQRGGMPRRLSQLGMGRARLRKLNSSIDLGRPPPAINIRPTYQIAGSPDSANIVGFEPADDKIVRRYVNVPAVRPSMESPSLKSPSLFGVFPRLSSSSDRRDKEDETHSGRNSGSKKNWMSNVVGKIKGSKK